MAKLIKNNQAYLIYRKSVFIPHGPQNKPNLSRDIFNKFTGFIEPISREEFDINKIQFILDHTRKKLCNEAQHEGYNYFISWQCLAYRRPEEKIGTYIILTGPQGVGKTILFDKFLIPYVFTTKYAYSSSRSNTFSDRFN